MLLTKDRARLYNVLNLARLHGELTIPQQPQSNPDAGSNPQSDMGSLVPDLAYAVDRGITLLVAPYDLTPIDVRLLTICRRMDECTATQLARLLPVDAGRISRLVNTLVERDLLSRRRPRDDRRVVMLSLTPEGEEVVGEIDRSLREYFDRLTNGLSEQEVSAFAAAAQRIVANYDEISSTLRVSTPPGAGGGGR